MRRGPTLSARSTELIGTRTTAHRLSATLLSAKPGSPLDNSGQYRDWSDGCHRQNDRRRLKSERKMSAPMRSAFGIVLGLMVSLSVACGGHKQTSGPFLDPQARADVARVTTCFNAVLSAYGQWAYTFGDVGQSEILRTTARRVPSTAPGRRT